ncbi:DNA polymerase III subunit delta' [Sediminicurvatus halobius]|uniref:DNA-directed DNA polymerase n=1 Tax=Sediminicurvatus halobius TaxID=2182432 RepID=A0A2U2N1Y6_9GAMM|nr:DNA polymerase III subunit delta' [Spiribacter halobius]PWG63245.1 DNA polymerase III subunit delta' [Spiribacter halobius]
MTAEAPAPLPWQEAAWQRFTRALAQDRLAHALLLAGPAGTGKGQLARAMLARLLCTAPTGDQACGACHGCRLRGGGAHPDCRLVLPEAEGSGALRIEAIRGLGEFLRLSSQYGGWRVALIEPAEAMTHGAANSLLKLLEEPPPGVVLLLVSHRPARLPPTVRSRCQLLRLGLPTPAVAEAWLAREHPEAVPLLAETGGAPLAAVRLAEAGGGERLEALARALAELQCDRRSAVATAAEWEAVGPAETAALMQRVLARSARLRALGREADRSSASPALQALAQSLDWSELFERLDGALELARAASQPLNALMALEGLFLAWSPAARGPAGEARSLRGG